MRSVLQRNSEVRKPPTTAVRAHRSLGAHQQIRYQHCSNKVPLASAGASQLLEAMCTLAAGQGVEGGTLGQVGTVGNCRHGKGMANGCTQSCVPRGRR